MKPLLRVLAVIYCIVAGLFGLAAIWLIVLAVAQLWEVVVSSDSIMSPERSAGVIEGIGLLAVALVALEICQTVIEEEVVRQANVSAPTRVRRYLSRFLVVVVVALSIEGLVGVVKLLHSKPSDLPYAASVIVGAGLLLAAWGVFIKLNKSAEEIEPEGMREAKEEDKKV